MAFQSGLPTTSAWSLPQEITPATTRSNTSQKNPKNAVVFKIINNKKSRKFLSVLGSTKQEAANNPVETSPIGKKSTTVSVVD